jgi:peptide/nickel transport system ATP-binding protein
MQQEGLTEMLILETEDLTIGYRGVNREIVRAVDNASFKLEQGETLGVVGESGCGKSTLVRAIMGYLRPGGQILGGDVRFKGDSVLKLKDSELQRLRGRQMAVVPQNPLSSLTYHMRVGNQIDEILQIHRGLNRQDARDQTLNLFQATRLPEPDKIYGRYPHQLSGGQRQRVVISAALACQPSVMILDEPTTALDTTTEMQVLQLVKELREEIDTAIVYITHDLTLTNYMCDRVLVMQKGKIVERGTALGVFECPQEKYTQDLVAAIPRVDKPPRQKKSYEPEDGAALLEVKELSFAFRSAWSASTLFTKKELTRAVDQVNFSVRRGETLGLVGESGSGKSTIANLVVGLLAPSLGTILLDGKPLSVLAKKRTFEQRRRVQIIFQDPLSSLNPRQRIETILTQPLRAFFGISPSNARDQAAKLLEDLELPLRFLSHFPRQLSGGEQQRVAIARAFAAQPDLILCDEITSALDVSVQAHVLSLLASMQRKTGTACMFISHDLGVVREIAHSCVVLKEGCVVECGITERVFTDSKHPYTCRLLAAASRQNWLSDQNNVITK